MNLSKEQKYAIGGEISENGLNKILDLCDEYVELKEAVAQNDTRRCKTCKYHMLEEVTFGYVCCNGESEHVADWTDDNDSCEMWNN